MVDLHSHILPGIDDGAVDEAESLVMARIAVDDGIEVIVATPHHQNGIYNNPVSGVLSATTRLNRLLLAEGIPLTVLPGQEVHIHADFVQNLREGKLLSFNQKGRYVFLELPFDQVPPMIERLIFEIQLVGAVPILPHPERAEPFRRHPEQLYELVKKGALAQLTAGSLIGAFGEEAAASSLQFVRHNLAHFIASDAHHSDRRRPKLAEAYRFLTKEFGAEKAVQFQENARKVVEGAFIYREEPLSFDRITGKRRRFFGS